MNLNEAEQFIRKNISVTRQMVVVAKHFAANHPTGDSASLIGSFLTEMDATLPQEVVIHHTVDSEANAKKAAESLSWQLAICEAIWALVHNNTFIPVDEHIYAPQFSVEYTTIVGYGGGQRGGWRFDQYAISVPNRFRKALSLESAQDQALSDGDLYIHDLDIASIHQEIEEALRDAVNCFRHELYTPALAMLGKASEGAWLELGGSLLEALPKTAKALVDKKEKELNNPWVSVAKKVQIVLDLYTHPELEPVRKISQIDEKDLKQVVIWSDVVRESRNVIHYAVVSPTANTYEKLAALLLGAVPHLRTLYRVYDAAVGVAKEIAAKGI